ncbi:hypothetical protein DP62_6185 [Burkholderia pseudomallei]|nr:hypothetical protein DP62_6185 [Burkholderia pseudomallei]
MNKPQKSAIRCDFFNWRISGMSSLHLGQVLISSWYAEHVLIFHLHYRRGKARRLNSLRTSPVMRSINETPRREVVFQRFR